MNRYVYTVSCYYVAGCSPLIYRRIFRSHKSAVAFMDRAEEIESWLQALAESGLFSAASRDEYFDRYEKLGVQDDLRGRCFGMSLYFTLESNREY